MNIRHRVWAIRVRILLRKVVILMFVERCRETSSESGSQHDHMSIFVKVEAVEKFQIESGRVISRFIERGSPSDQRSAFTSCCDRPKDRLPHWPCLELALRYLDCQEKATHWRCPAARDCMEENGFCGTLARSNSCTVSDKHRTCRASPSPYPGYRDRAPECPG